MKKKTTFVLLTNCSTFSQCVHCLLLQQHKQRWKPEADDSSVRQDLHHSSVVGDHIHTSFMFVVFMHFSLYYWIYIDFVICYRLLSLFILTVPQMYCAINYIAWTYFYKFISKRSVYAHGSLNEGTIYGGAQTEESKEGSLVVWWRRLDLGLHFTFQKFPVKVNMKGF